MNHYGFEQAIRNGKAKGHLALADAVYNKAKAGNMDAAKLILSRRYGWHEAVKQQLGNDRESPLIPVQIYLPDNGRGPAPTLRECDIPGRQKRAEDSNG